ncbi:MAG: TonB-dependent receptor [Flavobacterium sp.]|nr:TonB-dependent receptor [Flavobacterium sp.]
MKTLLQWIFLLVSPILLSQTNGGLKGTVLDESNGKPVPGINVVVKNTKYALSTDMDGNYIFRSIPAGTYEVEFSSMGYASKLISEVIIKEKEITDLSPSLGEQKNMLNEVVITRTKAKTESVKSLLIAQKNSISVSDGISAETIKRTPDKSTSDVIKRISGASIQDNKFVIIRGLNDRYNTAFINGSPLPSSEPDRKAFSFDIFPSNMIDNLIISKTATPDLPGEFAGGVVQITTKSVPDKNFQAFSIGTGYNTVTTGQKQVSYVGGKLDDLGMDDGSRDLFPIPSNLAANNPNDPNNVAWASAYATATQGDWNLFDKTFTPNMSLQYTLGRQFSIGEKSLGALVSLTYNKTNLFQETIRRNYKETVVGQANTITEDFLDKNYSEQVLAGALANFSFKINNNNSISLKNLYSVNSEDKVIIRTGQSGLDEGDPLDPSTFFNFINNARWFTSNKIMSSQLNGDHYFSKSKIKINWNGSISKVSRSIPNLRRNSYLLYYTPNYVAQISQAVNSQSAGNIFYSQNDETITFAKTDISKKFTFTDNVSAEIKTGFSMQNRNRSFDAKFLGYVTMNNFDPNGTGQLLSLPDSEIFSPANMGVLGNGENGLSMLNVTSPKDKYEASSKLNAGYVMVDNIFNKWRLVWGVRVENYTQTLTTRNDGGPINLNNTQQDILPSLNVIYAINAKKNFRISYSKTLNRPEFRELAPFKFYDFQTQFNTQGSIDLKIATIKNFDLRYEVYPGKGQLFSFSVFTKQFENPIEIKASPNNPREVFYRNAPSAKNSGFEIEFRTLLSSLMGREAGSSLDNFTLFSNVALIYSEVQVANEPGLSDAQKFRPMQGQSPYVLNAGLQYMNNGWSASTSLNRVGNRIAIVGVPQGDSGEPTLWEKSRTLMDLQIAKSFMDNKFEVKLNVQNLLAQDQIFYRNNDTRVRNSQNYNTILDSDFEKILFNANNYYNPDKDDLVWSTKYGRTFSLSATYNF